MTTASSSTIAPRFFQSLRWWHPILIFVVVNLLNALSSFGFLGDYAFYNSFVQPSVAPPDWLFPIIWAINNVAALAGLYFVARNSSLPVADQRRLFWAEAIFWVLFVAFGWMYFGLQSIILGAINTIVCFVTTCITLYALLRNRQYSTALWWLPRFLWLCLAVYVSIYMALANYDPLFQFGPWW